MGKIALLYLQRNKEAAATVRITRAVKFVKSDKILSRCQSNRIITKQELWAHNQLLKVKQWERPGVISISDDLERSLF